MTFQKWADQPITPHYVRDESTPYSLPIVVRTEKTDAYTEADAHIAVSKLMAKLFSEDKWETALTEWLNGRIRKMVRKARGSAWDNFFQNVNSFDQFYRVAQIVLNEKLENFPEASLVGAKNLLPVLAGMDKEGNRL